MYSLIPDQKVFTLFLENIASHLIAVEVSLLWLRSQRIIDCVSPGSDIPTMPPSPPTAIRNASSIHCCSMKVEH